MSAAELVHHYTSIGALASILRHRTIRFSRLNTLDDTEEEQRVGDYDFGAKLFASCWVEEDVEDIAQWAMYGHAMKGVRLSLPRQPFALVPKFGPTHILPTELFFDGYSLLPDSDNDDDFIREVVYVDDVHAEYLKRVQVHANGDCAISGRHTDLATFKHTRWSFQREVRFILHAMLSPAGCKDHAEWHQKFLEIAGSFRWRYGGPDTPFIDLPIAKSALEKAEIVLGPLCDNSDQLIVESLSATLAPTARIRSSQLTGLIRNR